MTAPYIVRIGLSAAIVLSAGACTGDDPDQAADDTTTSEAETTTTTSTTLDPTTTTFPIVGPAPWTEVVRDVYGRLAALNADPDPNLVSGVIAEDCPCFASIQQSVQGLATRGERIVGEAPMPVAVQTEGRTDLPLQRLTVKLEDGPSQLVDANGAVLEQIPPADTQCASVLVMRSGPANDYRVHDLFQVQRCPDGL